MGLGSLLLVIVCDAFDEDVCSTPNCKACGSFLNSASDVCLDIRTVGLMLQFIAELHEFLVFKLWPEP